MKLEKLKKLIVKDLVDVFESKDEKKCFKDDILTSENVWEIQWTLQGYGWDKQGSENIIFKHLIKDY